MKKWKEFEIALDIESIMHQMKIFWITFLAVFLVVSLQYLGVKVPKLLSPVSTKVDVFDQVAPKLAQNPTIFSLSKSSSFIPEAHAAFVSDTTTYDNASAYVLIDYDTGDVIAEKNMSKQIPIASLTKIMTAVVSLDLASPSDTFTVSNSAPKVIPTIIAVAPYERLTLEELLNAVLLTSANDAAEVVRQNIDEAFGEKVFIRAMNEKARILGLKNTNFSNPQGYDSRKNYSSAEDVAMLTRYALTNYPLITRIVQKDMEILPANDFHKEYKLYNWNGLLDVYPGVFGVKIGTTGAAGRTTVVGAEREGKKMLTVVLGAPGIIERDTWAAELLDYGFAQIAGLEPIAVTEDQLREKYLTWQ